MRIPFVGVDHPLAGAAVSSPGQTFLHAGPVDDRGLQSYLGTVFVPVSAEKLFASLIDPCGLPDRVGLLQGAKLLSRDAKSHKVQTLFQGGLKVGPIRVHFDFIVEMTEDFPELRLERVVKGSLKTLDFAHRVDSVPGGALLQSSYDMDLGSISLLGVRPFHQRQRLNNWAVAGAAYAMMQAFGDWLTPGAGSAASA